MYLLIVFHNGGQFAYTQDAPYTHLALAENIVRGTYGLNAGEPASPSSSILYPLLLALLSFLPIGQYSALVLCSLATLATALLIHAVAREARIEVDRLSSPQLAALTVTVTLAFNLAGLAFTGLEHSLHVTLTIASLLGMLRFVQRRQVDWWWLVAITLLPLLRFEAVAALAADMLLLTAFGKWRHALAIGLAGAAGVVAFGVFLHSLGLPWLPSSVLSRSEIASGSVELGRSGLFVLVHAVYAAFRANQMEYGGTLISALIIAALWGLARTGIPPRIDQRLWAKPVAVAFFVVIALAQLFGGSLNSFSRYEIYVLVLGFCSVLIAWQPQVNQALQRFSALRCAGFCMAVLCLFAGYVVRTTDTVAAAGNVHDQQYQLNRFVVEYWRRPFAANHPGWMNWRNPYYMAELSGLGSEDARKHGSSRDQVGNTEWLNQLARSHDVGLAILYDNATPSPATDWQPVARLRLRGRVVSAVGPTVTFYATRPDAVALIRRAVAGFAPTLPAGAAFEPPA